MKVGWSMGDDGQSGTVPVPFKAFGTENQSI